jgi:hypothetical protein
VSLLLRKRSIERAVLGELPRDAETELRRHMAACAACRAHYDGLALAKETLDGGAAARAREQARLFAALDAGASAAAPARRERRRLLTVAFVLAPAAAVVLWLARPPLPREASEDVAERGGGVDERPAAATLVVYASRKTGPTTHGPVRLVGELPGSGEARVSLSDYLQLGVRGLRAPAHVRVVGVDESGGVRDYVRDAAAPAGERASTLGGSVELARGHAAGRLRLVALFGKDAVDDRAVREAVARLAAPNAPAPDGVVTGLLVIEP